MEGNQDFRLESFSEQLIHPRSFQCDQLLSNKNQVAGHAGFFSSPDDLKQCLKPFNIKCVRGKREHLFYQLVEYFKRNCPQADENNRNFTSKDLRAIRNPDHVRPQKLYYKNFPLLTCPSTATDCSCVIDRDSILSLSNYIAPFYHVKHLMNHRGDTIGTDLLLEVVYSEKLTCPCYGRDPKEKSSCSRGYEKVDFLCLKDLTVHCCQPCIVDIKIGQVTYDPMAIKEKVLEQSSKYIRLREFGFRILGMKLGDELRDKNLGKTLETYEQVFEALDSYLRPLVEDKYICAILDRILERLQGLLDWFHDCNKKQLKFFSSSLLIVYDCYIDKQGGLSEQEVMKKLADSVCVSMIDFAHVFHVHGPSPTRNGATTFSDEKDNNYIFGLKKLRDFFSRLSQQHQSNLVIPASNHR